MSLDRPYVLSVCFRLIERLKLVSGTNVDLHMRQTKLINLKKLYDKCLLSLFRGRKFIAIAFVTIQPWLVRRVLSSTSDPTDDLNLVKDDPN